jgi:adenylate kinase
LDGFPRTTAQAEALAGFLAGAGRGVGSCLSLEVPDAVLLTRLTGRRLCRACGAGYHVSFSPPPADGRCGRCGGEIYQRDDDREETVKNRLDVFHRETNPLVHWYGERGLLKTIDGEGPVEEVTRRIFAALEAL